MKYLILFITTTILLGCASNRSIENCKIKKIIEITIKNEKNYYMNVIFFECKSKELREILVKDYIYNKYPSIKNKKIQIMEYLGKLHGQYKYKIIIE